jgi:hypothetical protein
MNKSWIAIAAALFFAASCGSKAVMGEMPRQITEVNTAAVTANEQRIERERALTNTLELQYHIFRINQASYSATPYTIADKTLFTAFSNEFATGLMNYAPSLTNAAKLYLSLTNRYSNDLGFIYTRAAACLIRISDYRNAGMLLNRSLMSGYKSDETCFTRLRSAPITKRITRRSVLRETDQAQISLHQPAGFRYFLGDLYRFERRQSQGDSAYGEAIAINPGRFYILRPDA